MTFEPEMNQVMSRSFTSMCTLRTTVRTTGFCGGDSGHGGRTEVIFEDLGATDIEAKYQEYPEKQVVLRVGGDAELRVLIQALRFSADALELLVRDDHLLGEGDAREQDRNGLDPDVDLPF